MRKWFILPGSLLVLSVLNAVLTYKLKVIDDVYLRVLAILLMSAFGYGLVGLIVAPIITNALDQLRRTSKRQMGMLGEWTCLAFIGLALYGLFFVIHIHGPEKLLPAAWRNGLPSSADRYR